ncbi:unnamed protein product [Tenebrio molitor]|nr:unnamed protein product [Tenebrio molitor]
MKLFGVLAILLLVTCTVIEGYGPPNVVSPQEQVIRNVISQLQGLLHGNLRPRAGQWKKQFRRPEYWW